jgi:Raf kinase inhibitor-like YbhB/YbcL family protein
MSRRSRALAVRIVCLLLVWLLAACGGQPSEQPASGAMPEEEEMMSLMLTSLAFEEGEAIPEEHTCDGDNVSPSLSWSGVPAGTRSLVLLCEDPDAPAKTWVHWVLYDMPPDLTELFEAAPDLRELPFGGYHGQNDFKNLGYGGPCPPPGDPHHYFFRLYALDKVLGLEAGATRQEVGSAMEGHILAEGHLMGTYARR